MKVLIYGGTTEGRQLSERLCQLGIQTLVSLATDYGEEVMQDADPAIVVRKGRMNPEEMRDLAVNGGFSVVVDATHPFAVEVSRNIKESLYGTNIPLIRLERNTDLQEQNSTCAAGTNNRIHVFDSAAGCAAALGATAGNILLTTGSKELGAFCRDEEVRRRIVARVLPGEESLALCREAGLTGRQIIAMQGPFSKEMDLAVIHQYGIRVLVTKESGRIGGTDAKLAAAAEAGIACYLIRRPAASGEQNGAMSETARENLQLYTVTSVEDAVTKLTEISEAADAGPQGAASAAGMRVTLAGVGMGTYATMTEEVKEAIAAADCIFGASRLLKNLQVSAGTRTYAMFRPAEILAQIQELAESGQENAPRDAVILFSGDSGFFSGAAGMRRALEESGYACVQIRTLPGVSCLSYLSAAAGIPWDDAAVVSLHGVAEEKWSTQLSAALRRSRKIFFLTSGAADVRALGRYLMQNEMASVQVVLGYQLSYPEEEIGWYSPAECTGIDRAGMYAGFILL